MELLPNFKLHRPKDLSSALKLKSNEPDSRYLAGGTDLVVNIRRGIEQPKNLIDLTSIEELQEIEETKSSPVKDKSVAIIKKNKTFFTQLKDATRQINELVFIEDRVADYGEFQILPYCDLHKKNIFDELDSFSC